MPITKLGTELTERLGRRGSSLVYARPKDPNYDPSISHYDREGNWVGDVTAEQASAYWKARARDFTSN